MDDSAEASTLPLELDGSLYPHDFSLPFGNFSNMMDNDHGSPTRSHTRSSSRMISKSNSARLSPVRGRTLKEYDQEISDLKKENFNLKLRIYYMEERMQQRYGDGQDVFKTNIELQLETQNLKKDLADKQALIQKTALYVESLQEKHNEAEQNMRQNISIDFKAEITQLKADLDRKDMECEEYRMKADEAERKVTASQNVLTDLRNKLNMAAEDNKELSTKFETAGFDVQQLQAQLRLAEQSKDEIRKDYNSVSKKLKDLGNQLEDSKKEVARKDRDMQNLSTILQDQSHIDSTSILEPIKQQDELEDALEKIKRKQECIDSLTNELKDRDDMIGALEDSLRDIKKKLEESETSKHGTDDALKKMQSTMGKYQQNLANTLKSHAETKQTLTGTVAELSGAKKEIKSLQASLKELELEKSKTVGSLTKELTDLEADNARLKRLQDELESTSENMVRALGKKEGELAGFKDQLITAMNALRGSEEAVEALHEQLKKERAEFDEKLELRRNELMEGGNQVPSSDFQQLRKQLRDLEIEKEADASKSSRAIAALEDEVQTLKSGLQNKDLQTQDVSAHLLIDLRQLLEQLRKDISPLSNMREILAELCKSGDTPSSAELLLTEISSVQRIYQQLEGGVEKNNEIHQALLSSLKGQPRQSDSPDSNSCQDGGHNLVLSSHEPNRYSSGHVNPLHNNLHVPSSTTTLFGISKSPDKIDRSFQTGTTLSQVDQWAQTSTGPVDSSNLVDNRQLGVKTWTSPYNLNSSNANDANLSRNQAKTDEHVHFASSAENIQLNSLTDDAKVTIPPQSRGSSHGPSDLGYCDFKNYNDLFGEYSFDTGPRDRASSVRPESRCTRTTLTGANNSESAAVPSTKAPDVPINSVCGEAISHTSVNKTFPGKAKDPSNLSDAVGRTRSADADVNRYLNRHDVDRKQIGANTIDFNKPVSKTGSYTSPGRKSKLPVADALRSKKTPIILTPKARTLCEENKRKLREYQSKAGSTDIEAAEEEERGEHQRSRRNSWADELEQYKVNEGNTNKESGNDGNSQQQKGIVDQNIQDEDLSNMSATELRGLIAQLQLDLVDSMKEKRALQAKLQLPDNGAKMEHLQSKLQATENTVRLLSKKNKRLVSALESTGIASSTLNRSNSESCLTSYAEIPSQRTVSTTSLHTSHVNRRLAHLLSPPNDRGDSFTSCERSRSCISDSQNVSVGGKVVQTSPPSVLAHSPTTSTVFSSPRRNFDGTMSSTNETNAHTVSHRVLNDTTDVSVPENIFKQPRTPVSMNHRPKSYSSDKDKLSSARNVSHNPTEDHSDGKTKQADLTQENKPTISHNATLNQSMHGFPSNHLNVTYSSMLDNTLLNRFAQMCQQETSMLSASMVEDMSNLSVDQLFVRVEHLERVNVTLREEIGVYEAMHRSQATQISASFCATTSNGNGGADGDNSDDEILRQHLKEIKKLRQRLERLDITKDPEQLLIFQSHTQQRLARQESMLAHLQQQLIQKEEQHGRDCAQLQHRLSREKASLAEKLEKTIGELRGHTEAQNVQIQDKEKQIGDLMKRLQENSERETLQDKDMKKLIDEKAEIEDDLVKRDKEFLDIEKKMFHLEMAKEEANVERKRAQAETEEKIEECNRLRNEVEKIETKLEKLRNELEEQTDRSKSLRDIVVRREKDLQEKVHNLQKVTSEKALIEQDVEQKENQVKKLENELDSLRYKLQDLQSNHEDEKSQLQSKIESLKADQRKRESFEARNAFQKASYEAELKKLNEEKIQMKASHEKELDCERLEVRREIDHLRSQVREKQELESEVETLRERVTIISELQYKVKRLEMELQDKTSTETDLRDNVHKLRNVETEVNYLREKLERSEDCLRSVEEEKARVLQDLKAREEKIRKRDTQLKSLINQHMKLDTTFTKQKNMLKEKSELLQSQKKQLRLFEVSLTASTQDEKKDVSKELIKELIATRRQVEHLLSQLEQNPVKPTVVRFETVSSSGSKTTVTTSESGQDNGDTVLSVGVREGSPEQYLGSLSPVSSTNDLELNPSSLVGAHSPVPSSCSRTMSPLRPFSTNPSVAWTNSSLSPRQLRYFDSTENTVMSAHPVSNIIGSDIRSLFAVFQLESHEKLHKEAAEGLTILSGIEARLEDRLRTFKAKSITESLEYSTVREASLSCKNLRICLEEAVRLAATAWITELPPLDSQGHFYDPVLCEQNETLKRELTMLKSRYDMLNHTVKEQQGRLQANNERRKNMEQSLYKQLHKTADDMEHAKENFDAAGMIPSKSQSLRLRSPNLSPCKTKRQDDTM